jgi:hypothetical protein
LIPEHEQVLEVGAIGTGEVMDALFQRIGGPGGEVMITMAEVGHEDGLDLWIGWIEMKACEMHVK